MPEPENQKPDSVERSVEFKFPLLILRTKRVSWIFDRLGSWRLSRYISWVGLFLVPIIAAVGLFFIVGSLWAVLSNPAVVQVTRQLGPQSILLLPGLNPLLPIAYGWIAIVVAIVIHEGAHGVVARVAGFRVKSSGLLFFLIIPIGAFVDVDEEEIKVAKPRRSLRVMAAGVGGNIAVAVVCLIGVLLVVSTATPVIDGVYISSVSSGLPAQLAGLMSKDVLLSVNGVRINSTTDLGNVLGNLTTGDVVKVTVARGDVWQDRFSTFVNLTVVDNRTVIGISVGDLSTGARLKNYETFDAGRLPMYLVPPTLSPGLVPFSDSLEGFYSSSLGAYWAVYANVLFWLWFVNVNVALFNALPLYPLDGGRAFHIALKAGLGRKFGERIVLLTTYVVTAIVLAIVLSVAVGPFIPF